MLRFFEVVFDIEVIEDLIERPSSKGGVEAAVMRRRRNFAWSARPDAIACLMSSSAIWSQEETLRFQISRHIVGA